MLDTRVSPVAAVPMAARTLLQAAEKKFGFVPNLMSAMAEAPALLQGYTELSRAFELSSLPPVEQQVVALAVSHFHRCPYCVSGHSMLAAHLGMAKEDLEALRHGDPLPTPRLETLRGYTLKVLGARGRVTREELEALLAAGYTRQQALEVNLGIAFKTLSNYTHALLPVPADRQVAEHEWTPPAEVPPARVLVTGWFDGSGEEARAAYLTAAGPLMKKYGGRPMLRAKPHSALVGSRPDLVVLLEFPSSEAAARAFADPEYRAIIPLRDQAFARLEVTDLGAAQ
jgi:AhpD family alkylhydroperoxidase